MCPVITCSLPLLEFHSLLCDHGQRNWHLYMDSFLICKIDLSSQLCGKNKMRKCEWLLKEVIEVGIEAL